MLVHRQVIAKHFLDVSNGLCRAFVCVFRVSRRRKERKGAVKKDQCPHLGLIGLGKAIQLGRRYDIGEVYVERFEKKEGAVRLSCV